MIKRIAGKKQAEKETAAKRKGVLPQPLPYGVVAGMDQIV